MGTKAVTRYVVYWVNLDPAQGSEMAKTRPCVVLTPNEMNAFLKTVVVAPLTSTMRPLPSRVKVFFNNQFGMVALDHIRSISKDRIGAPIGTLKELEIEAIKDTIQEIFVE